MSSNFMRFLESHKFDSVAHECVQNVPVCPNPPAQQICPGSVEQRSVLRVDFRAGVVNRMKCGPEIPVRPGSGRGSGVEFSWDSLGYGGRLLPPRRGVAAGGAVLFEKDQTKNRSPDSGGPRPDRWWCIYLRPAWFVDPFLPWASQTKDKCLESGLLNNCNVPRSLPDPADGAVMGQEHGFAFSRKPVLFA